MNEPKRRGRPPKAKVEALTEPHINGDDSRQPEDVLPVKAENMGAALAQAYALRVWNGQSPDVPRAERLRRVAKALEGQGLSMEGVEL
jgi:hypothetical protein